MERRGADDIDFRELVELLPQTVFQADARGVLVYANRAAFVAFGYSDDELDAGFSCVDMVVPEERERAAKSIGNVLRGVVADNGSREYTALRRDGTTFPVSIHSSPIIEDGRVAGLRGVIMDLTDMKQTEKALRDSVQKVREEQARTRAIVSAIGDGLSVVDTDYRVVFQNTHHKELFGDQVGRLCHEAYSGRGSICPDCPITRAFADGQVHRIEKGDPLRGRHLSVTASVLKDADGCNVAGIELVRDLTAARNAEDASKAQEARFRALVDSSPMGIHMYTLAPDGRLVFIAANRAADAMLDVDNSAFVGKTIEEAFPVLVNTPIPEVYRRIARDGGDYTELQKTNDDDGRAKAIYQLHAFRSAPGEMAVFFLDMTESKRMEDELLRAQKLESVGVLAGGIAHDFNNILAGILGNVSLARLASPDGGDAVARLSDAEKGILRARDLTKQFLTFAKGGDPVRTAASIGELVAESAGFALHGSNVRLVVDVQEGLRAVEVDEGQIAQVVHNLVINADHASPSGGTIAVSVRNVDLAGTERGPLLPGRYIEIVVSDEGTGIPSDDVERIFDPYFTTKADGSGLGLATVHSIVRRHGGHVSVHSEVGHGTTFRILLPATERVPAPPFAEDAVLANGRGRILLMDDEEMIRAVGVEMLNALGYEGFAVPDGAAALVAWEEAKTAGAPFDAVMMDLTIPGGMGGAEAVRRLVELDPAARAIVSSGYSSDPVMSDPAAHSFRAVLRKPYRIQDLGRVLREVLPERSS